MGTTKNAFIRYQTLDKCFSNTGRRYNISDLKEECSKALYESVGLTTGISRKMIYLDIDFMESEAGWGIELEKTTINRYVYYRYKDPKYSIRKAPLNPDEINRLKETIQTLSRIKGLPQFEWMEELIKKLELDFGIIKTENEIVGFQQNIDLKGLPFFTSIFQAIQNERVLNVEYKSFKAKESKQLKFTPQYLKQYNDRWFAFGKNQGYEMISNLALDRIVSIEESNLSYEPVEINWADYFEEMIGVTRPSNSKETKVVLQVEDSLIPYIETKPLHVSQVVTKNEEGYNIVTLNLVINYELESQILSFGEKVKVLAPKELNKKIKERLIKSLNNY